MAGTVTLWYRRRYILPPNDPRYLDLTYGEILTEYLAHYYDDLYAESPEKLADAIAAEDQDPDFDAEVERFLNDDDDAWEEVP
jgi:hypothetical protein